MLGYTRNHLLVLLAAIVCVMTITSLLLMYFIPAPPSQFSIATGRSNQIYEGIGNQYREILARSKVDLRVELTNGALENIGLLNDPASNIKAGIVQGGVSNGAQSPDLRSLGRINYQIYWIFCKATDTLSDLRQLKGKRVALGPHGSGQRPMTEKILAASGVNSENTTLLGLSAQEAFNAINDGEIDVLFLPFALDSPVLYALLTNPRVKPMSFTEADALIRIFPFLVRLVLPRAVINFEKIVPASDMVLIAASNVVLVRKDIHPALIDLLAQAIVETHGKPGVFEQAGEFPTLTDPEYPMAESARDFYKNGPSVLNRYLPFWITNHVQRALAVFVTVFAIILPLFSYAPRLYKWLVEYRPHSMYRRLKAIEAILHKDVASTQVPELEADLASVDRAIHLLAIPMQHSDLFFSIKSHLDLVRVQLGLRRAELEAGSTRAASVMA
jgi:TRAP-type uncharacterized transport system substrate-binding protein